MFLAVAAHAEVHVHDPWIAEAPPTARALAAFMALENAGSTPRHLVAAEASGFDRIELHRSIEEEGMHRMVKQEAIEIPAGGRVELAPGDYHVMLMGVQAPLRAGDTVSMRLIFANDEVRSLEVPVRRRAFMR
ncbi:MAG: copper chaperone PCu(A)C [Thioalkalivibrio sp.]|nr:copper chaperone PCu(A)C [Thioalkalivibrio sp.]